MKTKVGIDVEKLHSADKKIVTACTERHHGIYHEHTGGHLGGVNY